MNKKILGIKIGTIFMALISLIVAVLVWFFVEYDAINSQDSQAMVPITLSEAYDAF